MADNKQSHVVEYDYNDAPTLKRFALSNKRLRCVLGPFGCLRGDTLIFTNKGLEAIEDLTEPTHVMTYNIKENKYEFDLTIGSFRKGKDFLYEVTTSRGSFYAKGTHRILCTGNKYRKIKDLIIGDRVKIYSFMSEISIIGIRKQDKKEWYWDLHVPGNNNYVTEDGTIHHNSGKSTACLFEIERIASAGLALFDRGDEV